MASFSCLVSLMQGVVSYAHVQEDIVRLHVILNAAYGQGEKA